METVTPKIHHQRRRRSESRQRQRRGTEQQQHQQEEQLVEQLLQQHEEEQQDLQLEPEIKTDGDDTSTRSQQQACEVSHAEAVSSSISFSNENENEEIEGVTSEATAIIESRSLVGIGRTTSSGTTASSTYSQTSTQKTVLLVNGEEPPSTTTTTTTHATDTPTTENYDEGRIVVSETNEITRITFDDTMNDVNDAQVLSTTVTKNQLDQTEKPTVSNNSSRNSSGDAQSLRETLQQLRPPKMCGTAGGGGAGPTSSSNQHRSHHHHHHHHHRERERDRHHRTRSPRETSASGSGASAAAAAPPTERVGILGFMEREMRQCSPTPSTARSIGCNSTAGGNSSLNGAPPAAVGRKQLPSSLSDDPQASPAQRSIRSRSSLEKSPRRKRSKSESRRRRERKLIAAGEMEVRQANETLMRYLKQCSEMNDASLSGELEIDQSYDERRVHRKTKSQRDKRGHLISKLYTAGGGLSSLLKELSDDIVPAEGEEIYNPFTPVVSPTEDNAPAHIDKMFMQTSSGYRPVEHCYHKHHHHHRHFLSSGSGAGNGGGVGGGSGSGAGNSYNGIAALMGSHDRGRHFASNGSGGIGNGNSSGGRHGGSESRNGGMHASDSYGDDVRCLLEGDECNSHEIRTNIQLACVVQRMWLLISNICHGLLAGLALAHLLFVLSSPHPMDWTKVLISQMNSLSNEAAAAVASGAAPTTAESVTTTNGGLLTEMVGAAGGEGGGGSAFGDSNDGSNGIPSAVAISSQEIISDYAAFAGFYLNTFYCLAIICLVSVFDRMDICRWELSNASELISFRWLIIAMIYIATIILTICSDTVDEKLYYNNNVNITITEREWFSNSILNVWSSLSVTRSISAICGWIMIGLTPHEDLLYEHLVDLTKYQLTNN